jgi:Flp pilus assembly secretin CpaC
MLRSPLSLSRTLCLSAALATFLWAGSQPARAVAADDVILVHLNKAKVLQLPDRTSTIIIGNPIIADVTPVKRGNVITITGKGFGQTNLIALDAAGNALGESVIQVVTDSTSLIVQRGMDRESYNCAPTCQPTVNLGDSTAYMGAVAGQIQSRNQASVPGGK